jgi:hypothetical protein
MTNHASQAPDRLLGRRPAKSDVRALRFSMFAGRELTTPPPSTSNFWRKRASFPMRTFGNQRYGCCTRASQAILAMRMERIETRATPKISDDEIVRVYTEMSDRLYGGGDNGAYETDALNCWRRPDETFSDTKGRPLTIGAFTRINHLDHDELRWAIHLSGAKGIKLCLNLPLSWRDVAPPAGWDVPPNAGDYTWVPGSWGGHSLSADAYAPEGVRVVHTWYENGQAVQDEQIVSWPGIAHCCDEAHSVIDSPDSWRKTISKTQLDVDGIIDAVNAISSYPIKMP